MRLNDAAANLSAICLSLEMCEDAIDPRAVDQYLLNLFDNVSMELTDSVERRKAFANELRSKIELAKKYRDDGIKQQKRYELILERLIENTKRTVEANPDIPFKDALGGRLRILPNPSPTVIIIDPAQVSDEYMTKKLVLDFNKAKIKEDIKNGVELEWARLEYGTHLRGL